jgi:hypothetical protein
LAKGKGLTKLGFRTMFGQALANKISGTGQELHKSRCQVMEGFAENNKWHSFPAGVLMIEVLAILG